MTTKPQKKNSDGRYENTNYRNSDKFIQTATNWLVAWIFIGPGIGAGLGILGDSIFGASNAPQWYTIIAISFAISGVALPLTVGAWLGASALNKYAGPVGLLLVLGIGANAYGQIFGGMMTWVGIGAIVLSVVLFFYIGFQAKVPIWLQLPILKSPRLYIRKGEAVKKKSSVKK